MRLFALHVCAKRGSRNRDGVFYNGASGAQSNLGRAVPVMLWDKAQHRHHHVSNRPWSIAFTRRQGFGNGQGQPVSSSFVQGPKTERTGRLREPTWSLTLHASCRWAETNRCPKFEQTNGAVALADESEVKPRRRSNDIERKRSIALTSRQGV